MATACYQVGHEADLCSPRPGAEYFWHPHAQQLSGRHERLFYLVRSAGHIPNARQSADGSGAATRGWSVVSQ
jgi:hypothetical protein